MGPLWALILRMSWRMCHAAKSCMVVEAVGKLSVQGQAQCAGANRHETCWWCNPPDVQISGRLGAHAECVAVPWQHNWRCLCGRAMGRVFWLLSNACTVHVPHLNAYRCLSDTGQLINEVPPSSLAPVFQGFGAEGLPCLHYPGYKLQQSTDGRNLWARLLCCFIIALIGCAIILTVAWTGQGID